VTETAFNIDPHCTDNLQQTGWAKGKKSFNTAGTLFQRFHCINPQSGLLANVVQPIS